MATITINITPNYEQEEAKANASFLPKADPPRADTDLSDVTVE